MSESSISGWVLLALAVGASVWWYESPGTPKSPTLEQQRMCAEQADKYFKRNYDASSVYFDHFNPSKNKCFIQVTTMDNTYLPTEHMMFVQKDIFDAFEGLSYGTYSDSFNVETKVRKVSECSAVTSDGKTQDCKSEEEWARLTNYTQQ
jgi:hypothetical protein